jgi:recombination protein RecR
VIGVGNPRRAAGPGEMDEERRAAEVKARVRIRAAVGGSAQQLAVEVGQALYVAREERDLGDPGHVGTIRQVLSPAVENLVAQLSRLPGVGTRTAHRLAFHLLQRPKDEALALASAIQEVKERVRFCNECGNLTEEEVCAICRDARRDHTLICVVEQPVDLISVERTSEFRGLYHVLGGALSPLDGVEPEHLRIDELFGRVERNGVQEVVLATNPNMTGEATAAYLADRLRGRVRVTRLASGLPVGGDLEYADEVTLGRALTGRREM